ncbi:hypothetical protein J5X84_43655 [Streptosporangiaceae bacterium NEAU-GS5]|nr:hypothetical protein [Streptosporangiaceae bacterium NEAU-GS5]
MGEVLAAPDGIRVRAVQLASGMLAAARIAHTAGILPDEPRDGEVAFFVTRDGYPCRLAWTQAQLAAVVDLAEPHDIDPGALLERFREDRRR